MGPIYSLPDLLDMLRRRALVILAIAVLGSLVSLFQGRPTAAFLRKLRGHSGRTADNRG